MIGTVRTRHGRGPGLATLAFLLALVTTGPVSAQEVIDKSGTDVLRSTPFDRITLIDGKVILVEPISPRPLPPYDPKKDPKNQKPAGVPRQGNIFLPGEREKLGLPDEKEKPESTDVLVHLLEGDMRDFRLRRASVKKVDYFEDMLLAEGDRRTLARDFTKAFECFLRVQTRQPGWDGLDARVDRFLFDEGGMALVDGNGEQGLRLLRELFQRKPKYPGLADKLASAYSARARRAFEVGAFAKGRAILHELETLAPDHPAYIATRERFVSKAKKLTEDAASQPAPQRVDSLAEALRVWPKLDDAAVKFKDAFVAMPTLDVAVRDIPRPVGPWIHSPADERVNRLLYVPILARDDEDAFRGKLPGQLASSLELSDVGRKLTLKIREGVTWSDGSRPVSAIDVARLFTDRAESSSPLFNARWAEVLEKVETPDDSRVEVRLSRAFLKPGFWLTAPIGPAHASWDGRVITADQGRLLVGDGPFRWESAEGDRFTLSSPSLAKLRRIREVRHAGTEAMMGALIRGEATLVEHVPPDRVANLASEPEIRVGRYAQPALHRFAIDGRNPVLRNRSLRRGLSYAIDRKTLLEETILKRPIDAANLPSDGPFAKGSYADAVGTEPLGYNPILAKMLIAAARKELGGAPIKLTLEYPALHEAQLVVPKLVEAYRLIGLEIEAIERPESELEVALKAGRRFDLAYRVGTCREPILEAGELLCPAFDASPGVDALASVASPEILRLLMLLEQAPEWPSAKALTTQIDGESRDELPVIPLWQLEDHYAWRTRLKGPSEVSESLYQGIESWEVEPWYAKDPW